MSKDSTPEQLVALGHVHQAYSNVIRRWGVVVAEREKGLTTGAAVELTNDLTTLAIKLAELGKEMGVKEAGGAADALKDLYL